MKDKPIYCCSEISDALKLSTKRMIVEQAQKYFPDDLYIVVHPPKPLPQGGFAMSRKSVYLTEAQARFIISRSRGDTESAMRHFCFGDEYVALHRQESTFLGIVEAMLKVTPFELERQSHIAGYSVDGVIYGRVGALVIEYDERAHKYRKTEDEKRQAEITKAIIDQDKDVYFLRIEDSPQGIAEGIAKVSEIIHSDGIGIVDYEAVDPSMETGGLHVSYVE